MITPDAPALEEAGEAEGTTNCPKFTAAKMKISHGEIAKIYPMHAASSSIIPSTGYDHVELSKHGKK